MPDEQRDAGFEKWWEANRKPLVLIDLKQDYETCWRASRREGRNQGGDMSTLSRKKEALALLEKHGGSCDWEDKVAREALREQIAREEEEEAKRRPTLRDLDELLEHHADVLTLATRQRISRIIMAVEKLAPFFTSYVGLSSGPLNEFANAIAAEVRLDQ